MRVRVLLSLSPLCDIFRPSSVSLCPQDSPPPTDTVPDNYSLLILPVLAAPGVVFFIPAGAPSRPSQPVFLGRQSAPGSNPERESAVASTRGLGNLLSGGPGPLPQSQPSPRPPQGLEGLAEGTLEITIRAVNVYGHLPHVG